LTEELVTPGLFKETLGDAGRHGVGGPLDCQAFLRSDHGEEPSGFQQAPRRDLPSLLAYGLAVDHPA
jgi:hypothetical protein